jgi:cytidylate kinase
MGVVTISRELGSRGTRIAEAVGVKLGAPCIDKEVLAEMARQAGVQVEVIVEAEEKLMSRAGVVSQEMRSLFSADPSQRARPMDQETYVEQMTNAIRSLAQTEEAIFIGRGSQLILEDHPTALHVHLYAAPDVRASRIQRRRSMAKMDTARRIIQLADEQRRNWYQRFFSSADWKNSRHYHLMLDTGRIPEEAAVALIVDAARTAPPI